MSEELDVLAIGAHPDDIEIACGGTIALLVRQGLRVGFLHLTKGEMGTRGSAEEREQEAAAAGAVLGVTSVQYLDCGDGGLRTTVTEEDALIAVLRERRPKLILGPTPSDRHPDHERAHCLVREACFYAGLTRRGEGEAHRPAAIYSYMQHDPFAPSFVVDVSATWEVKMDSLAAYKSQLFQPGVDRNEPATKVASRAYREAIVGRARHYGLMIGAEFGEPFWSRQPVPVDSPWTLLPKKLR
jgi:bacillithiol biosynthesis deacetylase BshB1